MEKANRWKQQTGEVGWQSPANIALVKYWGKHPIQLPMNPSLSFALKESVVRIRIAYEVSEHKAFQLTGFRLNGEAHPGFAGKIENYLLGLAEEYPFINTAQLRISSESTFPHSAGIASSAAAFSALALCICSMDEQINGRTSDKATFLRRASHLARLGSGSACRSVYPGMVIWGQSKQFAESSDTHAWPLPKEQVHASFHDIRDAILIADSKSKKVSSSAGHALMHKHPYRDQRKLQAMDNLLKISEALQSGDWQMFGEVIENEALTLHSLMMSSNPGYILMHPNTLMMINKIRDFREETQVPAYFTLDAGPNIHLIYPGAAEQQVTNFIADELAPLCENQRWIADAAGPGPQPF